VTLRHRQGWINHLANWENARGVALSGASRLNIKILLFLVFHVFRLFNVRQNCRAFWWLRLVYKLRKLTTLAFIDFEWLKRIEPNSITLYVLPFSDFQACPWKCHSYRNPMGNVPWDGTGCDRHKLLWDVNVTDKYVPWTTLVISNKPRLHTKKTIFLQ